MNRQLRMPALESLAEELAREGSLAGWGVLLHMHLTRETTALGAALMGAGAAVVYLPSNRNPSRPEALAHAEEHGGRVLSGLEELAGLTAEAEASGRRYLAVEGNGRIFEAVHQPEPQAFFRWVDGISEHTSGGGRKIDRFDPARIRLPVVAVYRDPLKTHIESGLGTSQTVAAAILRGLQVPVAGRRIAVVGFGNIGQGIARLLRTLGARVCVAELQEEARLQARLQGFTVSPLEELLPLADVCVTATGAARVLTAALLERAQDGLTVTNVSNVPNEVDVEGCTPEGPARGALASYRTPGGRRFHLLGGGLQVNHVVEAGNPAELMDVSFTLHALALRWLAASPRPPGVHPVPQRERERAAALLSRGQA